MSDSSIRSSAPPRLPFALTVGVTGHRLGAIPHERRAAIDDAIRDALALIEDEARALHRRMAASGTFSDAPPAFTIVSPLADGADQIAAEAGLAHCWKLQAVLPFERSDYVRDFEGEDPAQDFDLLLARAGCVLELPGEREREAEAYLQAGRATTAHSDILLALWDGKPPRGRGGTAEIVTLAIAGGTPVIHVPTQAGLPVELLWSGYDPQVLTRSGEERSIRRPFDAAHLARLFATVLAPPSDPHERQYYDLFLRERAHRIRGRIEYPLLLTLAGVRRIRSTHWRESKCVAAIDEEWRRFVDTCQGRHGIDAPLGLLEQSYAWADRLAGYYAQTFRSGHVFNFVLAALAAVIGLSAFLAPGAQFELAVIEFMVAAAIIANTVFGVRHEWQRRWLDYRQLAERLRPMRSLKLLGVAAPSPPGSATDPRPKRWIDWYAAGVWRAMGCPHGTIDRDRAHGLVTAIRCHEIDQQIDYNERAARQSELLDLRLEQLGTLLFVLTLLTALAVMVGLKLAPGLVADLGNWTTLVSAGLPAIGTAIFGIRYQGDFTGSAQRSRATAQTLKGIAAELDTVGSDLARAADLMEQAARAMLVDLDEWRLVHQRTELEMG